MTKYPAALARHIAISLSAGGLLCRPEADAVAVMGRILEHLPGETVEERADALLSALYESRCIEWTREAKETTTSLIEAHLSAI